MLKADLRIPRVAGSAVEERRAYVEKVSGGRLGYVHLPDMGGGSLDQLHIDLDAGNHWREGVVVDIPNDNGGRRATGSRRSTCMDRLARPPLRRVP